MTIDWITVSAQIVNFLILVWLLRRFLYRPITDAMEKRERHIAERLGEAELREQAADESAARHQRALARLEQDRERLLEEARAAAESEHKRLLDALRAEVAELRGRWHQQVEAEKSEFLARLRREAVDAVDAMTRKVLRELADAPLEEQMVQVFLTRLRGADPRVRQALAGNGGAVEVATSFEPGSELRARLGAALEATAGGPVQVEYRHLPELTCGIRLTVGGERVEWNVARYLDDLSRQVNAVFGEKIQAPAPETPDGG